MSKAFVKLLHQLLHTSAEELWEHLGHTESITYETWPAFDEAKLVDNEIEIVVQINGKVKTKLMVQLTQQENNYKKLQW